jgi:hypothetical protein
MGGKRSEVDEFTESEVIPEETHRLRSMMMILLVAAIATIGFRYLVAGRAG